MMDRQLVALTSTSDLSRNRVQFAQIDSREQDVIYQKRTQHVRGQDSHGAYIKETSGHEWDNLQQTIMLVYALS